MRCSSSCCWRRPAWAASSGRDQAAEEAGRQGGGAHYGVPAREGRAKPASLGGPSKGNLREFWRWRLGDHRILAKLEDDELLVLVVRVGNRNKVYDKP
ncbi:type II toxin-antitoxin system RelE family toxin [Desulfocurvibacter africanus]|uniref:type II toxin-antitoxin system RelE family toxin n=1 Tax=Desulfocurvibacter africanus TaxID=873 RepID=UPI003A4DA78B